MALPNITRREVNAAAQRIADRAAALDARNTADRLERDRRDRAAVAAARRVADFPHAR